MGYCRPMGRHRRVGKSLLAIACAGAGVLLAGCASTGASALASGPYIHTLGFSHPALSKTYRFAFPILHNTTGSGLHVTGVSVDSVASDVTVVGYSAYSRTKTGVLIASSIDGEAIIPGVRLDRPKWQVPTRFVIQPHRDSDAVPMVITRLKRFDKSVHPIIQGCTVDYRQGGDTYSQTLPCEFALGNPQDWSS